MPKIAAEKAYSQIKDEVEARASEASAVTTLQRALAQLGYAKLPKVESTRSNAGTVRIYKYHGTPVGDLVLVTGPSIQTELHLADELARASAPAGHYIQVTGESIPASLRNRLEGATAAGKADVRKAIASGEVSSPVVVTPPAKAGASYPRTWAPKTTGSAAAPALAPAPAPAPAPTKAPRAPRAAKAPAAKGPSAADMKAVADLIAQATRAALAGK